MAYPNMYPGYPEPNPAKSMDEHRERRIKNFDFKSLKDGERKTIVLPAFDFFHDQSNPDSKYGQHSAELIFAMRKGNKIVDAAFHTGWTVNGERTIMDGRDIGLMCVGLYTHWVFKKDAGEYASRMENCPWTGKHCYGELGSSLYGDVILGRLINEGSAGVWDEIEKELDRES